MTTGLGVRHAKVERLRRLVRRGSVRAAERAFVVEGATLVTEALDAGVLLEGVYVAADAPAAVGPVLERAGQAGLRVHVLAAGVLERVAGTVTPQPVLAVAPWVDVGLDALDPDGSVVVGVDVRDPGNAGTLLRSAAGAGIGGVVLTDGSVDVFNPKVVRASAGALFHVPVVRGGEPASVLDRLGGRGLFRWGTAPDGGTAPDEVDLTRPHALVLGNESAGLPAALADRLDGVLTIPMAGTTESLNVGMAAAVICFEAARQRRSRSTAGAVGGRTVA